MQLPTKSKVAKFISQPYRKHAICRACWFFPLELLCLGPGISSIPRKTNLNCRVNIKRPRNPQLEDDVGNWHLLSFLVVSESRFLWWPLIQKDATTNCHGLTGKNSPDPSGQLQLRIQRKPRWAPEISKRLPRVIRIWRGAQIHHLGTWVFFNFADG